MKFCALNIEGSADWCNGIDLVELLLPAKDAAEIRFTFSVPADVEVGEHTGGILIQKAEVERAALEGQGIAITTRVGVRIYQTVPGEILKEMKIKNFFLTKNYTEFNYKNLFKRWAQPETITVTTEVENLGNVSVDFVEYITITDLRLLIIIPIN